jgi:hypothetical protein
MACDEITKNGTPCKRGAICWQHLRIRAQREVKKRADGIWKTFRPFAFGVATSLVAAILYSTVPSGIKQVEVAWSGLQPKTTATTVEPPKQTPLRQDTRGNFEPPLSPVALLPVGSTCNVPPPATSSVSLQENFPTTDQLGVSVNRLDPTVVLGVPTSSWPGNQSLSDTVAAMSKTTSETGILSLTGGPQFPPSSFDPSKMISTASMEQMKALLDASEVASSQTGLAQTASLQMPANTGILTGISSPSGFQISSPTITGNGTPIVLPSTWQTFPSAAGTTFPTTVPTTLPISLQ